MRQSVRYAPITDCPLSSLALHLPTKAFSPPLSSYSSPLLFSPFLPPLSLSCDKCQSAGRCKWPKQGGQVSFIPAKTVFSPILLKKWPKRGQVSFMYSSKDCFPSDMYCSRVGRERRHHVVPFVSVGSKPMFRCTASEFKASAEFTLAPLN